MAPGTNRFGVNDLASITVEKVPDAVSKQFIQVVRLTPQPKRVDRLSDGVPPIDLKVTARTDNSRYLEWKSRVKEIKGLTLVFRDERQIGVSTTNSYIDTEKLDKDSADYWVEQEGKDGTRYISNIFSSNAEKVKVEKIARLNAQVVDAVAKRAEAENNYRKVLNLKTTSAVWDSISASIDNDTIKDIKKKEIDLYKKLSEMSKKYGTNHPKIITINSEIADLKNRKTQEAKRIISWLKSEYLSSLHKEESVKKALEEQKADILNTNTKATDLRKDQILTKGTAMVKLRNTPIKTSDEDFIDKLKLDNNWRPLEFINNKYIDNKDGTITDQSTGLMWQESLAENITYGMTKSYIQKLNDSKFSGYNDWRLPTVGELKSLLTQEMDISRRIYYLDPIFHAGAFEAWTSDQHISGYVWVILFDYGNIYYYNINYRSAGIIAVRSIQ